MREIKFRGKGVDYKKDKWIYGDYTDQRFDEPSIWEDGYRCEVDPKTVGQYTGLNDKNGVEVYEGDVLTGHKSFVIIVVFKDGMFTGKQSNCEYHDALAMWGTETREVLCNIFQGQFKHLRGE